MKYIVICLDDKVVEDQPDRYTLATRTVFDRIDGPSGAARYAAGISPSRCPIVVSGRFDELAFDAAERFPAPPDPCEPVGPDDVYPAHRRARIAREDDD